MSPWGCKKKMEGRGPIDVTMISIGIIGFSESYFYTAPPRFSCEEIKNYSNFVAV